MFSIAAINDTDTRGQWEPLAPTKEAQEFYLSQKYHEGLLKLQSEDYPKARELLEAVLHDPMILGAKDGRVSDDHLVQLKFLSLKNLATVFLKQGSAHHDNALNCYLQAVEIDAKDSVVWNQLGTLSCSMGLLSTSRWAFEQGLLCSPNNWNCMEKLLEVLIAIGDEAACLCIADLILRHWPSHSRAMHVKRTIEDGETAPFAPRGIDKLQPNHVRLKFSNKRKATNEAEEDRPSKKVNRYTEVCLSVVSWDALAEEILGIISHIPRKKGNQPEILENATEEMIKVNVNDAKSTDLSSTETESQKSEKARSLADYTIVFKLPLAYETADSVTGIHEASSSTKHSAGDPVKSGSADDDHHHERRSSRLESLRSRKPGKEELDSSSSKNLAKIVFQFLEPFVFSRKRNEDDAIDVMSHCPEIPVYLPSQEHTDVLKFINSTSKNYGAYHLGHLLLEEIVQKQITHLKCIAKLLDLEKLTRQWPQDRTPFCSLFLAELCYDHGLDATDESTCSELFSEASYHLCKVIEWIALHSNGGDSHDMEIWDLTSPDYPKKDLFDLDNIGMARNGEFASPFKEKANMRLWEVGVHVPIIENSHAFWARFSWLSASLSLISGNTAKAIDSFSVCCSILKNQNKENSSEYCVFLLHCKHIKWLSQDRVLQQINLLRIQSLLTRATDLIDKQMYGDCIDLLAPLLHFTDDIDTSTLSGAFLEDRNTLDELAALDILISACERVEQLPVEIYLKSHKRKLQLLALAAGSIDAPDESPSKKLLQKNDSTDLENSELVQKQWKDRIAHEVNNISQCASRIKSFMDQAGSPCYLNTLTCIIGDIQYTLLRVMYGLGRTLLGHKLSGSSDALHTDQIETQCLVDAAIAFCKLQHVNPAVPIKTQVDLIVAIHDLLADFGLCCAGKDSEGKEGTFLKLAIKHLLALDVKLKSSSHLHSERSESKQVDGEISHVEKVNKFMNQNKSSSSLDTPMDGQRGNDSLPKPAHEDSAPDLSILAAQDDNQKKTESMKDDIVFMPDQEETHNTDTFDRSSLLVDSEKEKVELGIDDALDQSFFCLYGLDLRSGQDSSCEDDLAIHKNTNRGDYQTKEQCADVFQYILPYAKASSRAGLVKLRRVLRAIRKHFPHPVDDILGHNFIEEFLDSPNLSEEKLFEIAGVDGNHDAIVKILYGGESNEVEKKLSAVTSGPYSDVYNNLYYYMALAEDINATDKLPGFVLNKEGGEFVEQNANLLIYDLLHNPLRFESWQKLANIYDEEVDLLLNDGSKHVTIVDWGKNCALLGRVEKGRRRSRRCLLMSLALASTSSERSQIHELLGLVYYDSLQNVVPFYDQRTVVPAKDAEWFSFCRNSLMNFEKALALKPDWIHAFYLGKLCEKMSYSPEKAFSYYSDAISLNPAAVDPFYRMHASRLKLLCTCGMQNVDALRTVSLYSFHQSTKQTVSEIFNSFKQDCLDQPVNDENCSVDDSIRNKMNVEGKLDKVWHLLYDDCLSALCICTDGDLKHYHKARFTIAQGLCKRNEKGDLERAKDELSFCFRSSRSPFTINMWEIDSTAKKARRKTPSYGGNKRNLEVNLPESSRKFITCIRKYILLYLNFLEKLKDLCTLERAYTYLRTDRRFSLCIGDIVPLALGRYIKVLTMSILNAETSGLSDSTNSSEHLLEKMFHILMDHMNLWGDICTYPEIKCPEISEKSLYGFIHQFIYLSESNARLDVLEGINEKMRKRFKNPKLASPDCAKICRHASLAWCRSILVKLALITPAIDSGISNHSLDCAENSLLLFVDLQPNELYSSLENDPETVELQRKWHSELCKIRNIRVRQALAHNMEAATSLLKCAYSFYRDSSCGTFPSGITLYTVVSSQYVVGEPWHSGKHGIDIVDLSVPRKLLLWAFTLVHGYYSNILPVVKYCEEIAKLKMKRGVAAVLSCSTTASVVQTGSSKERYPEGRAGADEISPTPLSLSPLVPNETSSSGSELQLSTVKVLFNTPEGEERR